MLMQEHNEVPVFTDAFSTRIGEDTRHTGKRDDDDKYNPDILKLLGKWSGRCPLRAARKVTSSRAAVSFTMLPMLLAQHAGRHTHKYGVPCRWSAAPLENTLSPRLTYTQPQCLSSPRHRRAEWPPPPVAGLGPQRA